MKECFTERLCVNCEYARLPETDPANDEEDTEPETVYCRKKHKNVPCLSVCRKFSPDLLKLKPHPLPPIPTIDPSVLEED